MDYFTVLDIYTFIFCQLHYCNSLLYGWLDTLLHKLQSEQNATTRLITGTRHGDHIVPVLRELHWRLESMSSAKLDVWFTSRSPGDNLSTWQMISALCLIALSTACGQLTLTTRLG